MLIAILVLVALLLALHLVMVIAVAEISVHPPILRRPCDTDGMALNVARAMGASAELVKLQATDGITLSGWWMQHPSRPQKGALLCHGVADTAFGVMGAALMYLRHGYSVLAPDNRGHGGSGGFVTYGVREAGDIAQWQAWMAANGIQACYGFGESLGASSLLQSLNAGAQFKAIVAECAFSSFQRVAFDRVSKIPGHFLRRVAADFIADLWVKEMLFYLRIRYGVDMSLARPVDAVKGKEIPMLLIHGTGDDETPPHHSEEIAAANPAHISIWIVPEAKHTGAFAIDPLEFESRVMALQALTSTEVI